MQKIMIMTNDLGIGGIEKGLLNLLVAMDKKQYEITLILLKKKGELLSLVPPEVKVVDYHICDSKFILFRKIYNRLKLKYWGFKLKNKYDASIAYYPYNYNITYLAQLVSKNPIIFGHTSYYHFFNENEAYLRNFFKQAQIEKFKNIVMVSNQASDEIKHFYPELASRVTTIKNLLSVADIKKLSLEKIDLKKPQVPLFVNVARQSEFEKKITRIIEAARLLKNEGKVFEVWLVGDGPSNNDYEKLIKENALEDTVKLIGSTTNPYPYFLMADAFVLSSQYEGGPIVNYESMILNTPLITTDVADCKTEMDGIYGIVVPNSKAGIYSGMKQFLEEGFQIKKTFDAGTFNNVMLERFYKLLEK